MRLLVPILVSSLTVAISLPMSSISPEGDHLFKELRAAIESPGPVRTRRSITAFLAAEVLFLEGILAAQNGKKNVKKVKGRRPVNNNHIHPTVGNKHSFPPPVRQDITRPTTVKTTTTIPISQLDPFIMLTPPDLSRSKQTYTDDIFTEVVTPDTQDTKREVPLHYQHNKYGEFELYNPIIFTQTSDTEDFVTSTALAPSTTTNNKTERKPRKIVQKYGAFELYEPSFVIRQNKVKTKGGKRKVSVKDKSVVNKNPESLSSTFFTRDQILASPGQEWRKVRRRRSKISGIDISEE